MTIDSRVAHGIAGRHLEEALQNSARVIGRIQAGIKRHPTRPATAKGARRELREYREPVAKHSLWWTEGEDRHDGPFLAWLGTLGGKDDLPITRHQYAPIATRSLTALMHIVGKISLHAVARCLQRNGTLAWDDVKPLLAESAGCMVVIAEVANRLALRQIAVPAGGGLFVGDFSAKDGITMQTYIVLDEAQPSRWRPVQKAIRESFSTTGLTFRALCLGAAYHPEEQWNRTVDRVTESLRTFGWLGQAYDPRLDPVSAAWNDYRARAAGA